MRLYVDIFTDEEFLSDVYKSELANSDCIMKVKSSYKLKDQIGDVDVGKTNI
jgi:hypothetical protein